MLKHKLRACLLAFGLLAMAFGPVQAQTASPGAPAQMQNAQRTASAADQLKAAGATMVPRLPLPKQLASVKGSAFVCGETSCACRGPKDCMELFDLKACAPNTTKCTQPASQDPYCRCDRK